MSQQQQISRGADAYSPCSDPTSAPAPVHDEPPAALHAWQICRSSASSLHGIFASEFSSAPAAAAAATPALPRQGGGRQLLGCRRRRRRRTLVLQDARRRRAAAAPPADGQHRRRGHRRPGTPAPAEMQHHTRPSGGAAEQALVAQLSLLLNMLDAQTDLTLQKQMSKSASCCTPVHRQDRQPFR